MTEGHGGDLALAALRRYGVEELFTLSGAHVFPLYDALHTSGLPIHDVRHEATAVFAAEATSKLQRRPAVAALTAGPGVTNGISAVTTAQFNGSAVMVIGGRAPQYRWGSGSLQEIDHVPILAPITKHAATSTSVEGFFNGAPNADFNLRLYSNPGFQNEGKFFEEGPITVTTDADGNASFVFTPTPPIPAGRSVTATATNNGGSTSEFSAAVVLEA